MVGGLVALGGWALDCAPLPGGGGGGMVSLGPVSRFSVGTWTLDAGSGVVIGRDAGGLFAYSAVCTHAGCEIDPPDSSGNAVCRCHGSVFDGSGAVLRGPAFSPLDHFPVTVLNGAVEVDTSKTVDPGTRTPAA
jgi:Rieske Fe-S protein